jgi:group I intron endonuclease
MFIYKITNIVNGKCYIGQTIRNPKERLNCHRNTLKNGTHYNPYLMKSWIKYGESNFTFEVIESCGSYEELDFLEQYYIKHYNSCDRKHGYNADHGGHQTKIFSLDTRLKMRSAKLGKTRTDEAKNKTSETLKLVYSSGNRTAFFKGQKLSEETRKKMSKSHLGKKKTREHIEKVAQASRKKIRCLENNTTYNSLTEAALLLNVNRTQISTYLNGRCKTVGGYTFEYVA